MRLFSAQAAFRTSTREQFTRTRWLLTIKLLLLTALLIGTNYGAWQHVQVIESHFSLGAFFVMWILSALGVLCIAFSPSRSWRYTWTAVLIIFGFVGLAYRLITNSDLGLAEAEQLLEVVAFADNVTGFYARALLVAGALCAIGIVAINMPPYWDFKVRGNPKWLVSLLLLVPFVPVGATAGILYVRGGEGTEGLAAEFNGPAFALVLGVERLISGPQPKRRAVAIAQSSVRPPKTVVVIMDESVRGDVLDINSASGAYSGLLRYSKIMANFGLMSSIANCSSPSNAGFRYGVSRKSYLTDMKTNPSIWSYAKKAGYRTVYIDGQRHGGGLHNMMTAEEASAIDDFVQLPADTPPYERDMEIARRIRKIVEDGKQYSFVYVNKMGLHFPYEGKYPPGKAIHQPIMQQTYFGTDIDPKNILRPQNEDDESRLRFRNSYLNAVSWNVGNFFDTLLTGLNLSNAVVVYMSDHGQDLHEDGRPGSRTHCTTKDPAPGEGIVPLVVVSGIERLAAEMRQAAGLNRDRVSQFNVFPTVLAMLGYSHEDIARSASSERMFDAELPANQQKFLSRYFTRFGTKPLWNSIRLDGERYKGVVAKEP